MEEKSRVRISAGGDTSRLGQGKHVNFHAMNRKNQGNFWDFGGFKKKCAKIPSFLFF